MPGVGASSHQVKLGVGLKYGGGGGNGVGSSHYTEGGVGAKFSGGSMNRGMKAGKFGGGAVTGRMLVLVLVTRLSLRSQTQ
jgi:hypothetical protein